MESIKKQQLKQITLEEFLGLENSNQSHPVQIELQNDLSECSKIPEKYEDYEGLSTQMIQITNEQNIQVEISEWSLSDVKTLEQVIVQSNLIQQQSHLTYDPRKQSQLDQEDENKFRQPSKESISTSTYDCIHLHLKHQLERNKIQYNREDLDHQIRSFMQQFQTRDQLNQDTLSQQFQMLSLSQNQSQREEPYEAVKVNKYTSSENLRDIILKLYSSEKCSQKQICKRLNVSLYKVRQILKENSKEQSSQQYIQNGRKSKVTNNMRRALVKFLVQREEIFSIKDAQEYLKQIFGIEISRSHIYKIMKKQHNLSYKQIYYTCKNTNSNRCIVERQWAAQNFISMMKDNLEIINIDESSLQLINQQKRGWAFKGQK